ncbi:probable E3 ubiquitin-protein ligase BAH1-like 1 isoform X1 [Nymphaea colorata]|nr:probable E3 ubiquitin-protein ligase BAH1-like 1 isoform X1 [Nymphaea colorata]
MKFGETFSEYLHGDQGWFLDKVSHVEYKRLKKVLKNCSRCRSTNANSEEENENISKFCRSNSCPECDQRFFSELTKEASDILGCLRSRVRRLLHLHYANGLQGYVWRLWHCFSDPGEMMQEGRLLVDYVLMNAIAIRKILKKYDKVHCSVNGRNFKSKMQSKRIELLQSPWMIELGAFYLNCESLDGGDDLVRQFSCDLGSDRPAMILALSDSMKLEYNLTCPICLDIIFHPYALGCGHLFCKGCICSAASVLIFEGPKFAPPESKCPVCRSVGVYEDSVHMVELDLLLKNRCKEYWKERLNIERAQAVKQSKEFWDLQTKHALGFY